MCAISSAVLYDRARERASSSTTTTRVGGIVRPDLEAVKGIVSDEMVDVNNSPMNSDHGEVEVLPLHAAMLVISRRKKQGSAWKVQEGGRKRIEDHDGGNNLQLLQMMGLLAVPSGLYKSS